MTRKAKPAGKAPTAAKKPAAPKAVTVYTVVRKIPAEFPTHTTPERVFATPAAARRFADARNRELRALVNPFDCNDPDSSMTGGDKAFVALLKKLGVAVPTKIKNYSYIDWAGWWDRSYFDMTDEQRGALWDALDKFDWYKVKATTLE